MDVVDRRFGSAGHEGSSVTRRLKGLGILLAATLLASGCAAGKAFRLGEDAMKTGDLDQAVAYYRQATQADPENVNYKIALDRAHYDFSGVNSDSHLDVDTCRASNLFRKPCDTFLH